MSSEAEEIINELFVDFNDLDDGPFKRLSMRLKSVNNEIGLIKSNLELLKQERQNKLRFAYEVNSKALTKGRQMLGLVSSTNESINEIISKTVKLDVAQNNLTIIITFLERFRSFLNNLHHLENCLINRDYQNMAGVLLATHQLSLQFKLASNIDIVREHFSKLNNLESMINRQMMDLFESMLKRRGSVTEYNAILLARAALIIESIGNEAKEKLIRWYCDRQLNDYKEVFRGNRELANLENIPKRYAWLKRLLILFEAEHSLIFPENWKVEEFLCINFCVMTCRDIADIMQSIPSGTLDLTLLQAAVQQTRSFELFLQKKFNSGRDSGLNLSRGFEQYLYYFVEAHELELTKFQQKLSTKLVIVDFDANNLLTSASELFLLFKEILQDITDLSNRKPLVDLCIMFTRQLNSYCKYLEACIPKLGKNPPNSFEIRCLCVVINTLDYCQITIDQMTNSIDTLAHPNYKEAVTFDGPKQEFLVQISVALSRLYQFINLTIESTWICMAKVNWDKNMNQGDQSEYIYNLQKLLNNIFVTLRPILLSSRNYLSLVNKLTASILQRFKEQVFKIKVINDAAAKQLMVDLESLRGILIGLLHPGESKESLLRLISVESLEIENFLKVLLIPDDLVSSFVQNYLLIMVNVEENKFISVLQAKGIKKAGHLAYLEEFRKHVPEKPSDLNNKEEMTGASIFLKEWKFFKLDSQLRRILSMKASRLNNSSSHIEGNKSP